MSDPNAVMSAGAIILGFLGGIAGNIYAYNLETKRSRIALIGSLFYILAIVLPFLAIFLTRDITQNETVFFTVIGVLFAVIGSVSANIAVNSYYKYTELLKEEKWNFRNWTVVKTWIFSIELILMLGWLLWLFHQVST